MARTIPSGLDFEQTEIHPILLVKLVTSLGDVRVWTGFGDLTFNSETYAGIGELGGVGPIKETSDEVRANGLALQLSGIPSDKINIALTGEYRGRDCTLWLGLMNPTTNALIDTIELFGGRVDMMTVDEGPETSTITVDVESRLADLDRPRVRRYTDQDQKQLYPNDRGLEYVAGLQNVDFVWG